MTTNIEIDGQQIEVSPKMTVIQAAAQLGIYIPHFCYHPELSIAANCRMCLVDVGGAPKALPACATFVTEGMVVKTQSKKAVDARHGVMEFLLINHPLDCPICDQGGECQLQDMAVSYGMSKSRYQEEKRVVLEKNLGPLIATDMTRCIHCTRCVRFGQEVAGVMELGMVGRGEHAEILPFVQKTVDSELSGNMIDICPVGALTSKPFRFSARTWEMRRHTSISPHDGWGSSLSLQVKNQQVKRVVPHENPAINDCWLSDRDRFSYEAFTGADRALVPMIKPAGAKNWREETWPHVLEVVQKTITSSIEKHGADSVAFFANPNSSLETLLSFSYLTSRLGLPPVETRLRIGGDATVDIPALPAPSDIANAFRVFVIGADIARELPLLAYQLRRTKKTTEIISMGALDCRRDFSIDTHIPLAPDDWVSGLSALLVAALAQSDDRDDLGRIFPDGASLNRLKEISLNGVAAGFNDVAKSLGKKNRRNQPKILLLGAEAIRSPHFPLLLRLSEYIARLCDLQIGVLAEGANAVGAAQVSRMFPSPVPACPLTEGLSRARVLFFIDCEPEDFSSAHQVKEAAAGAQTVISLVSFTDKAKDYSDIIMPLSLFYEDDYSVVNLMGQIQSAAAATAPAGDGKPGWKIARVLAGAMMKEAVDYTDVSQLRQQFEDFCRARGGDADQSGGDVDALLSQIAEDAERRSVSEATGDLFAEDIERQADRNAASGDLFTWISGYHPYRSDPIVRRAPSLQRTALARRAARIGIHPDDAARLGLIAGGSVRLTAGESESPDDSKNTICADWIADERLMPGCLMIPMENEAFAPLTQGGLRRRITVSPVSEAVADALEVAG